MKWLANLLGGGLLSGVDKILGRFFPDRDRELDAETRSLTSAQRQFAAEFHRPTNWFDSIINGLNRLPRPFMALSALGLLWLPFFEPALFALAMQSLALVPDFLWGIIGGIFAFYFGARHITEKRKTGVSHAAVKEFTRAKREYNRTKTKPAQKPADIKEEKLPEIKG